MLIYSLMSSTNQNWPAKEVLWADKNPITYPFMKCCLVLQPTNAYNKIIMYDFDRLIG